MYDWERDDVELVREGGEVLPSAGSGWTYVSWRCLLELAPLSHLYRQLYVFLLHSGPRRVVGEGLGDLEDIGSVAWVSSSTFQPTIAKVEELLDHPLVGVLDALGCENEGE